MLVKQSLLVSVLVLTVCEAFIGSSDDAYMKKYAIRKVWESCFGSEVLKQIRLEKRAAISKCRSYTQPAASPAAVGGQQIKSPTGGEAITGQPMGGPEPRPEPSQHPMNLKDIFPPKKRPSAFSGGAHPGGMAGDHGGQYGGAQHQAPNFDLAKLQALFGYKNIQNGYLQPQQLQPASHPYNPFMGMHQHYPSHHPQYQGDQGSAVQGMPQYLGGGLPPFASYQHYPVYQANRFSAPHQAQPFYQQQYQGDGYYGHGWQRASRNLDLQTQIDLEALHRAIGAKADNVSCQLQELGYLDENLDPAYEKISERVKLLPVEEELKVDMLDGLEFCKRFSQCMPDMRKDAAKFSKDQDRQMFFFSCYKHKKLEACLMKDVRERFMTDDPLTQEDLNGDDLRSLPRGRKAKMPDFKDAPTRKATSFDDFFVADDELYSV